MGSATEEVTGLRNERKACHFWVDNEVADCYQPIVGADAIWVYCRIVRNAHGAWIVSPKVRGGDTRVSLREMAEWCGKSTDTVSRCLQVLEHVGLLRVERGSREKGRYALVDVKDLVTGEGGTYDREVGCFQLPPARAAELKQQVRELRLKMARKAVANSQLSVVGGGWSSVAQSDRLEGPLFSAPDQKCDRTVAPDVQNCRSGSEASITQESKTAKQKTTPLPPQAGGSGFEKQKPAPKAKAKSPESGNAKCVSIREADAAEWRAVDQVCCALSIGDDQRRLRRMIKSQVKAACEKGELAPTVALDIIGAVRDQDELFLRRELKNKFNLRSFISQGIWRNRNRWYWDPEEMRRQANARGH